MNGLESYLLAAAGKKKEELADNNPYREIGFDGEKRRLGWLKVTPFPHIKDCFNNLQTFLEDKESFIFIGMGGSINGIKPLITLSQNYSLYTLDNLDPQAFANLIKKISNIDKALIIPISKSGTTQETQLLASSFKELFAQHWQEHFLWLTDPDSFKKLNSLGWQEARKAPLQFDQETDVGGRFSCPHTLIFFLPLFLLLEKNINALEDIYRNYLSLQQKVRNSAYYFAEKYKESKSAYFFPSVKGNSKESFSSWVIQLFQESLGSKKEGVGVKTLSCLEEKRGTFLPLYLDLPPDTYPAGAGDVKSGAISLMLQMYFFQTFIAYYSAFRKINFVTQDVVEIYKEKMRTLKDKSIPAPQAVTLDYLIERVKERLRPNDKFIEIVLYFSSSPETSKRIREEFKKTFPDKVIFIFTGSDWNHHSYQAAVADKHTFYIFLSLVEYKTKINCLPEDILGRNIQALRVICQATYLTLKDKSCLFSLDPANV